MKKTIFIKALSGVLVLVMGVSMLASCTAPTPNTPGTDVVPLPGVTDTTVQTPGASDALTESILYPNTNTGDVTGNIGTGDVTGNTSTLPSIDGTTGVGTSTGIVIPGTDIATQSPATLPGWNDVTGSITESIPTISTGTITDGSLDDILPDISTNVPVETFPNITLPDGDATNVYPDFNETETDATIDTLPPETSGTEVTETETITDIVTDAPSQSATDVPSQSATDAPSQSATDAPQTDAPAETEPATEAPLAEGVILYKDGKFQANVIRKELADAYGKTFYNDVRALIKTKVGSQPSLKTDFVGVGKELDDGPAILIGDTDYPESKEVYKKLKANQAKAVVVGNKYVIAYTTEASATELFEQLETLFKKKASKTEIIIDSTWNKTVEIKGFDESGLKGSLSLPTPSGFSWATNGRDAGQGSKMYIANNATEANYTGYCAQLKKAGFTFYSTNTLHTNKFSTYVTKEQIVYVMFFAPKKRLTVVVDPRSTFALPGIEAENIYSQGTKVTEFVQLGLKQISGSGENGMGYLVKLSNGKFVVVDGGFAYDSGGGGNSANFILATMKKMQGNNNKPVIAAYIVTHIHTDHAGGFMGFANSYANQVTIEKFIYNQPSDAQMNAVSNMSGRKNWMPNAINKLKNAGSLKSVIKAHPGMQIHLAELTITIMGSIDVIEDSNHTKMKNGNDSSVVSMFDINGAKFLLTGDCEPQEGKIIRDIYGGIGNTNSVLKSDFIQVAHHGYGNTNTDYIGRDQNALNVMASGGGTGWGSSPIYALVPVGLANGKDPAGYYDAVQGMHAMGIFAEDHRLVAYNKNMTIKVDSKGKYTIDKQKHDKFWIGTWSTW